MAITTPVEKGTVLKQGSIFTDTAGRTGTVEYDTSTGKKLSKGGSTTALSSGGSVSNPAITSTETRSGYDALGNEIQNKLKDNITQYDSDAYRDASAAIQKSLDQRMKDLERIYQGDVGGIKSAYEEASLIQGKRQEKDYAGRATQLVTAGGGFLGATQSQQGVLQNLTETFQQEKNALMAKRDAALQEASNAFAENSFNIAQLKLKEAKDTEQELYNRQQDFNAQQLDLAKENRAQTEFEYGITDKRAESYANLTDEMYAMVTPEQKADIDKRYYPGYLDNLQEVKSKEAEIKTAKDALDLEATILDMRLKMPYGKSFNLGGVTYTGLKAESSGGGTQADRDAATFAKIDELFSNKLNTEGSKLYTIPEPVMINGKMETGVPFTDEHGYLTPEGWLYAVDNFNIDPTELIKRYAGKFNPSENYTLLKNYRLTPEQQKLINQPKL
jgi:hypothetical protein